ncbi:MAG: nucleoside hydrolase [Chloroflexi bacterium]|nr:nucleoside hydrolase [Chloroflexota bacterium]
MPIPIIIDTDPGMDDALAILLALRSPEVELRGLTIVAGNVDATQGAINAGKILKAAGRCDIPVAVGTNQPLLRPLGEGWPGHGADGLGGFGDLPSCDSAFHPLGGVRFLIETILASPQPVTLVPIGPLTNIALALAAEPAIIRNIKELVIMGGAVFCPGNSSPTAEFNIWIDPEAARMVFAAGVPIRLVGLDVTMQTILRPVHADRIAAGGGTGALFGARVARAVMPHAMARFGESRMHLHDPLAVGAVIDPTLVRTQKLFVDVETAGFSAGQTVADGRNVWKREPNVDVCVEVDGERFVELFVERLSADN